jgi:predicted TPR repeat methyltransferase
MKKETDYKTYWKNNIIKYGEFYKDNSKENVSSMYKFFILPLEKIITNKRYEIVNSFLDNFQDRFETIIDLGCGTGIYLKKLKNITTKLIAVDFSESALEESKNNCKPHIIEYLLLDITNTKLPESDFILCIGVTPYIKDIDSFFNNTLPTTKRMYCFFSNKNNIFNMVRRIFPSLNIRGLNFYSKNEIKAYAKKYAFDILQIQNIGTGFLVHMKKNNYFMGGRLSL